MGVCSCIDPVDTTWMNDALDHIGSTGAMPYDVAAAAYTAAFQHEYDFAHSAY